MSLKSKVPESIKQIIRPHYLSIKSRLLNQRSTITEPVGYLSLEDVSYTFVVIVGLTFNQNKPDAMMTCRMGYCNAFESLNIPYIIVDINDLENTLPNLNNPFCMVFGADYAFMSTRTLKLLRKYPKFVWVDPWFNNSDIFFKEHGLDKRIWSWPEWHRKRILQSEPEFVYTATVESGLNYFEKWVQHGMKLISLPLACDVRLYNKTNLYKKEFANIKLAFVGGYWESKGRQIDKYLRQFEDDLVIYGYNKWPYKGYRGKLSREDEPSLYQQAIVSPTVNEPSVKIMRGVINERVFKVFGSGGLTVVDAVPAYRELFSNDQLLIPSDENEFREIIAELLNNEKMRDQYRKNGYDAVMSNHTYINRAKTVIKQLNMNLSEI